MVGGCYILVDEGVIISQDLVAGTYVRRYPWLFWLFWCIVVVLRSLKIKFKSENQATLWLHLASWNLPDSQLGYKSKMEPSVAKNQRG